ncbi:hypothetical protein [uncultured Aquimarina sp.]|uniref:hypothetical protein n=1 Tax=uncultured Aquimarina sp. TaxID=575652 RepID=UPI002616CAF8|nr:hypothetical protein [uncultured Aquimarina sp.]
MLVENKIPYNDAFWNYLNHQLKIHFRKNGYSYDWIYPIEISVNSLFKKKKTNEPTTVNTTILFVENGEEKEYLGKIIFGNYSRKAYANIKGTDFTKCYPKSNFTEWIKIDESNSEIEINLK